MFTYSGSGGSGFGVLLDESGEITDESALLSEEESLPESPPPEHAAAKQSSSARIRLKAVNNVFFSIADDLDTLGTPATVYIFTLPYQRILTKG